jgi:hypothetical protein
VSDENKIERTEVGSKKRVHKEAINKAKKKAACLPAYRPFPYSRRG